MEPDAKQKICLDVLACVAEYLLDRPSHVCGLVTVNRETWYTLKRKLYIAELNLAHKIELLRKGGPNFGIERGLRFTPTALQWAIAKNRPYTGEYAIETALKIQPEYLKIIDRDDWDSIRLAVWYGRLWAVEKLHSAGFSLYRKVLPPNRAFCKAWRRYMDMKDDGTMREFAEHWFCLLDIALIHGHADVARYIVSHQSAKSLESALGVTSLMYPPRYLPPPFAAILARDLENFKLILQNPLYSGLLRGYYHSEHALHVAAASYENNEQIMSIILSHDADANPKSFRKHTPLFWALEAGNEQNARYIMDHGATVDGEDMSDCGCIGFCARSDKWLPFTRAFISQYTDSRSRRLGLALIVACYHAEQSRETIKTLLNAGASLDVSLQGSVFEVNEWGDLPRGSTFLHALVQSPIYCHDIFEQLVGLYVQVPPGGCRRMVPVDGYGLTPLQYIIKRKLQQAYDIWPWPKMLPARFKE